MLQWESAGQDIQRFPVQTLERAKRKSLTGPIGTIPPPISLHESWIPDIVWGENLKLQWCSGRVQDLRSRDPQFKPWCPSTPELNNWNCQRWKPEVGMVQCWSAGLEIHRSPVQTPVWAKRKSLTGPNRTMPPTISLHQSYISDISRGEKQNLWCAVVECRPWDRDIPSSSPSLGKKKIPHRSNQNITTTNPLHQSKIPKIDRCEKQNHCCSVVECRTRDPEVPSLNPGVGKKKIFHKSNQNYTTTNPSTPELNTWNCQRWKQDITAVQC